MKFPRIDPCPHCDGKFREHTEGCPHFESMPGCAGMIVGAVLIVFFTLPIMWLAMNWWTDVIPGLWTK